MQPVAIGIVGCGVIGKAHIRLGSDFELVNVAAVADVNEQAARAAAEEFDIPRVYTDAASVFADPDIEAVVLALPTGIRTSLAVEALGQGKHVLIEKPPAMNADEVRQIIAARGDRVVNCCSSRMRGTPSAEKMRQIVDSGELGRIRAVQCRCVKADGGPGKNPPPVWRVSHRLNGGGFFVNWGIYDMDYLLGLLGFELKPRWVLAQAWPLAEGLDMRVAPDSDAECHALVTIRCEGGEVVTMERAEFTSSATQNGWNIVGEKATLRPHMVPADGKKCYLDRLDPDKGVQTETVWEGDENWDMCHAGPIRDFARTVREGSLPASATSLDHALQMQKIIDAVYESSSTGRPVELGDD